jgi:hypothetical protein
MVDQDPDRPFRTRGWAVPLVVAYVVHGMVELGHRALMSIQQFHALTAPLVADGGNAARLTAPRRCRRMPNDRSGAVTRAVDVVVTGGERWRSGQLDGPSGGDARGEVVQRRG